MNSLEFRQECERRIKGDLFDDGLNRDYHVEITLTVDECRQIYKLYAEHDAFWKRAKKAEGDYDDLEKELKRVRSQYVICLESLEKQRDRALETIAKLYENRLEPDKIICIAEAFKHERKQAN